MRPANGKILVLNHDGNPIYGILGGSRIDLDDTPSAQKTMRRLSECGRAAPLRIITALLAAAWVGTPGLSEARPAQPDALVSAAQNVDFGGAAGNDGFQTAQLSRRDDKSVQLAQKGTNDTEQSQQDLEQEHHRAEMLSGELATARHDVESLLKLLNKVRDESARTKQAAESETAELRKSIQQERDRAGRLEHDLAARPHVEAQRKPSEEASQLNQAADSRAAELRNSMQRDRTQRLERDLALAHGNVDPQTGLAAKTSPEPIQPKQAAESGAAEPKKALQQERNRAERLERDLATARRDVETQTALKVKASDESTQLKQAAESGTAELQKSLQQERERAERLERDLSTARRDVETQTALAAKASDESTQLKQAAESGTAELQKSLQQERERAERLERDLSTARRDVETQTALAAKASDESTQLKQVAESGTAELQKSLQQERERAERLERDLASARRDVETQTALAAKASDESTQLKQAAESGTAELQKSLQQERERAERLELDLAGARRDVETQTALAAKASDESTQLKQAAESGTAELQKSLQQERERAERLERDLASARRDVETQTALAAKASEEATRLKQVAEQGSTELRRSLQQERDRAEGLESDLAFARRVKNAPAAPGVVTVGEEAQDKQFHAYAKPNADQVTVADTRGEPQPNPEGAADLAKLMALASVLLGRGDIGAARIVLQRAVETGSAQASFTLAETYDPLILPKWGTYGPRGDAAKARDFYARAETGGIKEAKERFDALRR
jgi:hypothetical protein